MKTEKQIKQLPLAELTGMLLGLIMLGCCLSLVLAAPVMWLWNWLSPTVFHGPEITFWQAWGMSVFSNLIFKSSVSYGE